MPQKQSFARCRRAWGRMSKCRLRSGSPSKELGQETSTWVDSGCFRHPLLPTGAPPAETSNCHRLHRRRTIPNQFHMATFSSSIGRIKQGRASARSSPKSVGEVITLAAPMPFPAMSEGVSVPLRSTTAFSAASHGKLLCSPYLLLGKCSLEAIRSGG